MMKFVSAVCAVVSAVSTVAPVAPNYYSWFAPEIATSILESVVNGEYHAHLDYNGDGELTICDAVSVMKRYAYNVENGNSMTFGESDVMEIVTENYHANEYNKYFYYEIDFVNGSPCRCYEVTVSEVTAVHVYLEMNDTTDGFTIMVDPFKELIYFEY